MFLLNEIKNIIKNKCKDVIIFVDMDGVVADYRFGEGENIKNNKPGLYFKKRPIYTAINNLKRINDEINCEMCILSSCLYQEQVDEKNLWLNKYMPFIKKENRIYVLTENFETRKKLKINKIKETLNQKKCNLSILIDDTHEILLLALEELKESVIPFHVITLID